MSRWPYKRVTTVLKILVFITSILIYNKINVYIENFLKSKVLFDFVSAFKIKLLLRQTHSVWSHEHRSDYKTEIYQIRLESLLCLWVPSLSCILNTQLPKHFSYQKHK